MKYLTLFWKRFQFKANAYFRIMRNNFTLRFLLIVLFFLASNSLLAQYKYTVSLGGSNEQLFNAYGNHLRMYYNFGDNFRINAEFVRYYEVTEKNETETFAYDFRELNLNMNYAILFGERLGIYAVLGFTYNYGEQATINSTDTNHVFKESAGMNAGFGAFYKLGHFMPYIETRTVASGSSNYLIFSVGLAYSFGKEE